MKYLLLQTIALYKERESVPGSQCPRFHRFVIEKHWTKTVHEFPNVSAWVLYNLGWRTDPYKANELVHDQYLIEKGGDFY